MNEKKKTKKIKKPQLPDCPLTLDGWIAYLQRSSQHIHNISLSLIAINFSIVAIAISISIPFLTYEMLAYLFIVIILLTATIYYYNSGLSRQLSETKRLFKDIINGKYTTANEVREQWLRRLENKKNL